MSYTAKQLSYRVFWSEEDEAWVGICEQFRSLSAIWPDPAKAFEDIKRLSEEALEPERLEVLEAHAHGEHALTADCWCRPRLVSPAGEFAEEHWMHNRED